MKRKVIKQGNGTLTITLPKPWTKKVGLTGDDEIEMTETDVGLTISSERSSNMQKIQINAKKFNEKVLRLTLSAAHKSGFDEIEVLYDSPLVVKVVYELVKELYMGFSVVEQTQKRILLKSISRDRVEDFEKILRRGFLVALSMADSSYEMIKKNDFEDLPSLIPLEHFNNQLTNFCEIALNKKEYLDGNCFYYVVAWNLEKVCDNYKYICDNYKKAKIVNKNIIDLYKKVNLFFRKYYDVFYKFEINTLIELTKEGKSLKKEANSMYKFIKSDFDFIVINNLLNVILQCLDFSASYIAIHEFSDLKNGKLKI